MLRPRATACARRWSAASLVQPAERPRLKCLWPLVGVRGRGLLGNLTGRSNDLGGESSYWFGSPAIPDGEGVGDAPASCMLHAWRALGCGKRDSLPDGVHQEAPPADSAALTAVVGVETSLSRSHNSWSRASATGCGGPEGVWGKAGFSPQTMSSSGTGLRRQRPKSTGKGLGASSVPGEEF
mmetsp:Transcript_57226/g.167474  ORF Transcript_57226/g.167474 Transcript_57226/m.167474 type:complete len:182 (-) Transcript_57226:103-648(-)